MIKNIALYCIVLAKKMIGGAGDQNLQHIYLLVQKQQNNQGDMNLGE